MSIIASGRHWKRSSRWLNSSGKIRRQPRTMSLARCWVREQLSGFPNLALPTYAMHLLDLPPELLIQVMEVTIAVHPIPAHVLVLNKFIYGIATPILYRHPYLSSISAIGCFPTVIWGSETVCNPSTITVNLAGAEVGRGTFRGLLRLLSTTRFPTATRDVANLTRLELDDFRLCLHSTNDGNTDDKSLRALEFVE